MTEWSQQLSAERFISGTFVPSSGLDDKRGNLMQALVAGFKLAVVKFVLYPGRKINTGDFRILFLYQWKNDRNIAATSRSNNATFGDDSVNEHSIRRWCAKFESVDESLIK
ncbi:hypothetical protein TNCV_4938131 [Trichonephila clavipes]|nr:hypothetical protein TNCV_4938131 [Trichonephila clavipes]